MSNNSISENSRYISLSPENGTQFRSGQKVIFEVKPSISFLKGKDCYISLDLERDTSCMVHPCMLPGVSGLIERMDIYALESGQLLESLSNYNQWCAIENQYMTEDIDNIVYKEGCIPPFMAHKVVSNAETKALTVTPESILVDTTGATRLSTISQDGYNKSQSFKFMIPIKAGIFNHWSEEEKLTPNLLFGGMRIEITLARDEHVLSRVKSQNDDGAAFDMTTRATGIPVANSANNTLTTTADIAHPQMAGLFIGGNVTSEGDTAAVTTTITALTVTAGKIVITTTDANNTGANATIRYAAADLPIKYIVKNMEMKVLEVIPPQEMMKSVIKESQIDFISYETFGDNLPTTSLQHQVEFPTVSTKAKAIFTVYVPDNNANNNFSPAYYGGTGPSVNKLNSIQYFINNRNYPQKAYNPDCFEDRIVAYNEMVKAFKACGKTVKKLGNSKNMADYSFTYLTARELARGKDFVFPLKDAEAQLRLEFSGARASNMKLTSYVFSVRSIMISKDNLSVVY